jgi:multidrug transporter EmrE-like cation transporter
MNVTAVAMILLSVALSSGSQVILKTAMVNPAMQSTLKDGNALQIAYAIATSAQVIGGLACFGLSAVVWLLVLSRIPLSSAYPFVALGILVTVLAGIFIFGESVGPFKALGSTLILAGVVLVGLSGSSS